MKIKVPFSPPNISQEAINEVIDTLKSGWITTGPKTKKFEDELTKYCGNAKTLCVSSATFGLEHILRWFDVGPGDEVIIPAYTYCATINVVMHRGAIPVLVDIDESTFAMNPDELDKKINKKTKVVIPVDLAGFPCNYDKIIQVVYSHQTKFVADSENQKKLGRILILADAAHSFGARYKDKICGTLADITVFSFHAVKNLTTAEGGAIALNLPKPFNNQAVYDLLNILSLHGQNKDALEKLKGSCWKYDIISPGYKGNMTDIQASLGLAALSKYDEIEISRRRKIFKYYSRRLKPYSWAIVPIFHTDECESSYHVFTLRIQSFTEPMRDELINRMADDGIATNVHFRPLPLLSAYKELKFNIFDYPISYQNFVNEISLPVYSLLTEDAMEYVIENLIKNVNEILPNN